MSDLVVGSAEMPTHSLLHSQLSGATTKQGIAWPRVDAKQFPLYQRAKGWAYKVHAGDTLYIPANWWHWVRSESGPEGTGPGFHLNFYLRMLLEFMILLGLKPGHV
jgi:hypothetical protein